jgi:hypothetical protein
MYVCMYVCVYPYSFWLERTVRTMSTSVIPLACAKPSGIPLSWARPSPVMSTGGITRAWQRPRNLFALRTMAARTLARARERERATIARASARESNGKGNGKGKGKGTKSKSLSQHEGGACGPCTPPYTRKSLDYPESEENVGSELVESEETMGHSDSDTLPLPGSENAPWRQGYNGKELRGSEAGQGQGQGTPREAN